MLYDHLRIIIHMYEIHMFESEIICHRFHMIRSFFNLNIQES